MPAGVSPGAAAYSVATSVGTGVDADAPAGPLPSATRSGAACSTSGESVSTKRTNRRDMSLLRPPRSTCFGASRLPPAAAMVSSSTSICSFGAEYWMWTLPSATSTRSISVPGGAIARRSARIASAER